MYNAMFDFSIAIEVYSNVAMDIIEKKLNLIPTMTVIKGEKRPIVGIAEENIWVFKESFRNCEFIDDKIQSFINQHNITHRKIAWLQRHGRCVLRFYFQSEDAQLGFGLTPKDLKMISQLGLSLEFSVFSWGGIKDF